MIVPTSMMLPCHVKACVHRAPSNSGSLCAYSEGSSCNHVTSPMICGDTVCRSRTYPLGKASDIFLRQLCVRHYVRPGESGCSDGVQVGVVPVRINYKGRSDNVAGSNNKLHPLHSIEWVCNYIRTTGAYPDARSATGRTTALALKAVSEAISNPGVPCIVADHDGGSKRAILDALHMVIGRLDLKYMSLEPVSDDQTDTRIAVCFGSRAQQYASTWTAKVPSSKSKA